MRARLFTRWSLSLVVLCGAAAVTQPAHAINDITLVVAPGSDRVRPGDTVTVSMNLANLLSPMNGVQVLLRYDPTILTLQNIVPTNLGFAPPAAGWVEIAQTDVAGNVTYAISIHGAQVLTAHTAATLTFQAIAEGTTSITFRPDAPPFLSKLTVAADNSTMFPNKVNSGTIVSVCDDGVFCNGPENFSGGACQSGANPCSDGVPCTTDACVEATDSCTFTPNHPICSDGLFCNGSEVCDPVLNCRPGVVPCNDGIACTVDGCVEASDSCTNTPSNALCNDNVFCNGVETCNPTLGCQPGTFPCGALQCDEPSDTCLSPIHIAALEVFYAGKFRICFGGTNPGVICTSSANCTGGGICREEVDPSTQFLATGTSTAANLTGYMNGVTGIRVTFDQIVSFSSTPASAFSFQWTTGAGTTFSAMSSPATAATVTTSVENGRTIAVVVLTDNHVRRRWLQVTIDATQVTVGGVQLDGELVGNPAVMPSGNGSPGGNAVFYLGNVSGDVDDDRSTRLSDVGLIRNCSCFNPFVRVPITNAQDVDKDGRVVLTDVGLARVDVNPFFTLPPLTR